MLEKSISIAVKAHEGQLDKAGYPYILHPFRMMFKMSTDELMIIAILHDVVEDTPVTLNDLKEAGFSEVVLSAVEALTKRQGESYDVFIQRAKRNPLARPVKMADLEDNMDLKRILDPQERDFKRVDKYAKALADLKS